MAFTSKLHEKLDDSWRFFFQNESKKKYYNELFKTVEHYYEKEIVYPPVEEVFNAFKLTPLNQIKVVILGQDPYHGEGQAHGLAFSVRQGHKIPPSLKNIYKELNHDLKIPVTTNGDLSQWASQGVFLLNTALTVTAKLPGSHKDIGWELFTSSVINAISSHREHIVFLLWGKHAQDKEPLIDANKHLVLKSPHPSPFSARKGFFGSNHFSKANRYLSEHGINPINWSL